MLGPQRAVSPFAFQLPEDIFTFRERQAATLAYHAPNACNICHKDKDAS